jgi:alkylated DNA repair dioxygenase AlkB
VSLGTPRELVIRPAEGGTSRKLALGHGDLLVMGGTFQRTWRHGVPKVASAGPRIALMFRPKWAKNYRTSVDE